MSELRLNLVNREWVVINDRLNKSPETFIRRGNRKHVPPYVASCPFCAGNEDKTPREILRISDDGHWHIRVAPNKYPLLEEEGERSRYNDGIKRVVSGVGRHEVIIESPRHDTPMATQDVEHIRMLLGVYQDRFIDAYNDKRVQHVVIFKNHGEYSGTTITHPHTQLVGTPVMPLQLRFRIDEAMRYFDSTGNCLMCMVVEQELKDRERIIVETGSFISFIPYAALSPFHLWIFPRRHIQSLSNVTADELTDLSVNLKETLLRLYVGLEDPSFNMAFRSLSPFRSRSEYVHWYLSITPQLQGVSGFELGSGIRTNPLRPEVAAEFLRNVKI